MPENGVIVYSRTDAFQVKKPGQVEKYYYWTVDPAYGEPGFYIREHQVESGGSGSMSMRITENMTERAALSRLAEMEREAGEKYRRCDETSKGLREKLGDNYFKAIPFRERITDDMRREQMENLRSRRQKAHVKLKPGNPAP